MSSQAKATGGSGKLLTGLVIGLVVGLAAGVFLGPILDSRSNVEFDASNGASSSRMPSADSREDRSPPPPPAVVPVPVQPQPEEPKDQAEEPIEG